MIGVGRELPDQSGYLFRTDAPAAPYVRDVTDERWHESARHYEAAGAPRSAHDPALHPDRRRDRGPRYFEALTRIAERYELLPVLATMVIRAKRRRLSDVLASAIPARARGMPGHRRNHQPGQGDGDEEPTVGGRTDPGRALETRHKAEQADRAEVHALRPRAPRWRPEVGDLRQEPRQRHLVL